MSDLTILIKKEVKELLTLKTVVPVIALTLMFAFIGQSLGGITEQVKEKPKVAIIDADNSKISQRILKIFEKRAKIVFISSDKTDADEALEILNEKDGAALLIIPAEFGENVEQNQQGTIDIRWLMRGIGMSESIPSEAINVMIQAASENVSRTIIENTGELEPNSTLRPISKKETTTMRGREFSGVSPSQISAAISSQSTLVPVVIMIIILMSGGQVIQSMGMEKGNKTLETLLTLPVKRSNIAIGKIMGSAVVGLVMAGIYMVGFGYYMSSFQPSIGNIGQASLALGFTDFVLLAVSLSLTIIAGLSICMLLGTFAQDYKSSQMLMFPLIILVFIPFFLTMFKSFYTLPSFVKLVIFLIPFSHPMMAVNFLMFGNYTLVVLGIVYTAMFILFLFGVISYIFKSDTLITGRFEIKLLNKFFRRGEGKE